MAKQVKLTAQPRGHIGRNAVKKVKKEGLVPAVMYGAHEKPTPLQVNARELTNILAHASSEHVLVELEIADGDQSVRKLALIQEVQHHPLRPGVVHVDLQAVSRTETVFSTVPIETFGDPVGVKTFGGLLEHTLRILEVECLPQDLPDIIRVDVSELNVGQSVHVRDLQLGPGVKALTEGDLTVVSVVESRVGEETETAAEAAAAPEVITEKKDESKKEGA